MLEKKKEETEWKRKEPRLHHAFRQLGVIEDAREMHEGVAGSAPAAPPRFAPHAGVSPPDAAEALDSEREGAALFWTEEARLLLPLAVGVPKGDPDGFLNPQ